MRGPGRYRLTTHSRGSFMQPHSIGIFDKLFLGSLALGLANMFLSWESSMAELEGSGLDGGAGTGLMIASVAIGFGISLLLWYFISRHASNIARWILIALTAIGVISLPFSLFDLPTVPMILAIVVTGMQLVAIYYLFRPDSKLFFENKGQGSVDPSTFE